MSAILEHVHLRTRNSPLKVRDGLRDGLVMASGQKEHGQLQLAEPLGPVVVTKQSGGGELACAPHVPVDLIVSGDAFTLGRGGQRLRTADKMLFEYVVGGHAGRIVGGL